MTLIREGIITATLLIIIGVGGYVAGDAASVTALIPAFFGILILLGSLIGIKNLKVGMHIAALFGFLGFIAPFGRMIPVALKGEFVLNLAAISQILMIIICGIFTYLAVLSFIKVRQERKA